MKILLINPYVVSSMPKTLSEPLGLISIKSYIDQCYSSQISIKILDLYALGRGLIRKRGDQFVLGIYDESQVLEKIRDHNPDVIGICCNFSMFSLGPLELTAIARKAVPGAWIVMGGAHATMDAENIMKNYADLDFIVRGEGEIVFRNLVVALKNNELDSIRHIRGLCYRETDGSVKMNPGEQLINDINILPIPDRSCVDMEFYIEMNSEVFAFTKKSPIITMNTSRGCPYECIFCSTSLMWQRQWRDRESSLIIKEIEYLKHEYNAKQIIFLDDQFLLDRKRIHQICDTLISYNHDMVFDIVSGVSPWLIDEELMIKMKRAGFFRLSFAIESGDQRTIKFIKKKIDLDDVLQKIDTANRLGFWTTANFILGFPYETREEMMNSIKFAISSNLDFSVFLIAKPFTGTELARICQEEGLLNDKFFDSDVHVPTHDTTTMTVTQLNSMLKYARRTMLIHKLFFFMNPFKVIKHFKKKLRTRDDYQYFIKLLKRGLLRIVIPELANRPQNLQYSFKFKFLGKKR